MHQLPSESAAEPMLGASGKAVVSRTVRTRTILFNTAAALVASTVGTALILPPWGTEVELSPMGAAVFMVILYTLQGLLILRLLSRAPGGVHSFFGPLPALRRLRVASFMALGLAALSAASLYAFYIAVSYLNPGWGEAHWRGFEPFLTNPSEEGAHITNALTLVYGALLAPVVEELVFRGALLTSLSRRWGLKAGVVISSALFAALHHHYLGPFVFGIVLCIVALRTGSLWLPVVAHFVNNLLAFAGGYALIAFGIESSDPSLGAFLESWWIGIACLVTGVLILRVTLREFPAPAPATQLSP